MTDEKPPEVDAPKPPGASEQTGRLFQLAMLGLLQRFILASGGVATISPASIPDEIPLQLDVAGDVVTIRAAVSVRKRSAIQAAPASLAERLKNGTPFRPINGR